jgi:hypothetical protein
VGVLRVDDIIGVGITEESPVLVAAEEKFLLTLNSASGTAGSDDEAGH